MSLKFVILALVVATAFAEGEEFNNEWDQPLDFACPKFEVLRTIYSIHDNGREDRRFRLGCGPTPGNVKPNKCEWTEDYVNDWDQPVMFLCPANYMITGIQSVHDNGREDRRMKIQCCRRSGVKTQGCTVTDYLNDWDAQMNYTVTEGKVLTGWFSYHDNRREDRRHKMIECDLS